MGNVHSKRILSLIYNDILREGVRVFVETEAALDLVHSLKSFDQSTVAVLNTPIDLALIDLDLPDRSSLEAIRCVRATRAEAWIVGLTTYKPDERIEEALLWGASAVIGKHEISKAILEWLHNPNPVKPVSCTRTPAWRTYLRGFLTHDDKKRFW